MPNENLTEADVIASFARVLLLACGACRVRIGLVPSPKPMQSTCELCSHTAAVHGPVAVPRRNGKPHGPGGE
jgi:hypothetical protein